MESFTHKPSLVPIYRTISISFSSKHPFAAHNILRRKRRDGVSSHVPLRIRASNSSDMAVLHCGYFNACETDVGSIVAGGKWQLETKNWGFGLKMLFWARVMIRGVSLVLLKAT